MLIEAKLNNSKYIYIFLSLNFTTGKQQDMLNGIQ